MKVITYSWSAENEKFIQMMKNEETIQISPIMMKFGITYSFSFFRNLNVEVLLLDVEVHLQITHIVMNFVIFAEI